MQILGLRQLVRLFRVIECRTSLSGGSILLFVSSVLGQSRQWALAAEAVARLRASRCNKRLEVQLSKVYNQGIDLMQAKNFAAAQIKFEQAIRDNPNFAEAHNNLGFTLRQQGPQNFSKALEHYNKAIQLKPSMAETYEYRGVLFAKMGRKADAHFSNPHSSNRTVWTYSKKWIITSFKLGKMAINAAAPIIAHPAYRMACA